MNEQNSPLGAQVWLERDDSPERIDYLFRLLHESGFGLARIFLLWPWIEPRPGEWNWKIYDDAFDAAHRHGIAIKATFTANSGPWHVGTPLHLHTHTGFFEERDRDGGLVMVRRCVERYHRHPALAQWVLWNEPYSRFPGERSDLFDAFFRTFLRNKYAGDIARLNERWRTGYGDFGEIPFPPDIAHVDHWWEGGWSSHDLGICLREARVAWMQEQLGWLKEAVRGIDGKTETCINLTTVLDNHPLTGTDLVASARLVDTLGASFHPPWIWKDFDPSLHAGLTAVGVATLRVAAGKPVEITEMQFGGQVYGTPRPASVGPDTVARNLLAGLAAGASSVTGWCFNTRHWDFEAGDWSLLDENDNPTPRSAIVPRVVAAWSEAEAQLGALQSPKPTVYALTSSGSQIIEDIESRMCEVLRGRSNRESADGAAAFAHHALRYGLTACCAPFDAFLASPPPGGIAFAGHMLALDTDRARHLLEWVASGGTLVVDALFARKDPSGRLNRPRPPGFDGLSFHVREMETCVDGYPIAHGPIPAGTLPLCRANVAPMGEGIWRAFSPLRFADSGEPVALCREHGKGRLVFFRGLLAAGLAEEVGRRDPAPWAHVFCGALFAETEAPRCLSGCPRGVVLPLQGSSRKGLMVLSQNRRQRVGGWLRVSLSGRWRDLWSGQEVVADALGECSLPAEDGIALLVEDEPG